MRFLKGFKNLNLPFHTHHWTFEQTSLWKQSLKSLISQLQYPPIISLEPQYQQGIEFPSNATIPILQKQKPIVKSPYPETQIEFPISKPTIYLNIDITSNTTHIQHGAI